MKQKMFHFVVNMTDVGILSIFQESQVMLPSHRCSTQMWQLNLCINLNYIINISYFISLCCSLF